MVNTKEFYLHPYPTAFRTLLLSLVLHCYISHAMKIAHSNLVVKVTVGGEISEVPV